MRRSENRFPDLRVQHRGRLMALAEFRPPDAPFAYELAVRPPGVRVVGLTPDGSSVWLTDEFRVESGERDVRLPGGKVVDSLGTYLDDLIRGVGVAEEDVIAAAHREFEEEVGLPLVEPRIFHMSPCGATVLWDLFFVIGTAGDGEPRQSLERGEDIRPMLVDKGRALELARFSMSEERAAVQLMRLLWADSNGSAA